MHHIAFGYHTIATAQAYRALRPALAAWTKVSPIWHVCMRRLKPLSAPVGSPFHAPRPLVVHWHRMWC
eukprot:5074456-Pyramimonas_sp.AAC.1